MFDESESGPSLERWQRLVTELDSNRAAGTDPAAVVAACRASYTALPLSLQQCCLDFAGYPEDWKLTAEELLRLWSALLLVPSAPAGMHFLVEEAAEDCLVELMCRSIVQEADGGYSVHAVMRDVLLAEACKPSSGRLYEVSQVQTAPPMYGVVKCSMHAYTLCMEGIQYVPVLAADGRLLAGLHAWGLP